MVVKTFTFKSDGGFSTQRTPRTAGRFAARLGNLCALLHMQKNGRAAVHMSRALSRASIGVLRFDFAGTRLSIATGAAVSFAADVEDLPER